MEGPSPLLSLPAHLLFKVVELCDPLDWVRLGATCKARREVTSDKRLWEKLVIMIPACGVQTALGIQTYACVVANSRPRVEIVVMPSVANLRSIREGNPRLYPRM